MKNIVKKLVLFLSLVLFSSLFTVSVSAQSPVNTYPLFAGQDWEIGYLEVTNDENNLSITYNMYPAVASQGWIFTELHLAVELTEPDIPQTNKGNPIPGAFEFSAYPLSAGPETFTVPIPYGTTDNLVIAAHAAIEREEVTVVQAAGYGAVNCIDCDYDVTTSRPIHQGLRYDGELVRSERSDPSQAFEFETTRDEHNFYSLGFDYPDLLGAYIILEFDNPIMNGAGADLKVIEDTWGLPYPAERAEIYVSNSPTGPWTWIGTADNQTPMDSTHTVSEFDLPSGWISAKYVKVEDATVKADFASLSPSQDATLDGFDLNAVLALHDYTTTETFEESAWAAEAIGEIPFMEKGSWATYINYGVRHGTELVKTLQLIQMSIVKVIL